MRHKSTCNVLGRETRAVASCAEAAYYIGAGRSVVLVLQPYLETEENMDESMDMNRGRAYPREMAKESQKKLLQKNKKKSN